MPLNEFICWRISPEVVLCFHFAIVESTGTHQKGGQYLTGHRISDKSVFLIVFVTIFHQMVDNSDQMFLKQRDSNPKITNCNRFCSALLFGFRNTILI